MPQVDDDFHETWISDGVRQYYGVKCNCTGTGPERETCMAEAISSRVRPSAEAARRLASSSSRAAFSCRIAHPGK